MVSGKPRGLPVHAESVFRILLRGASAAMRSYPVDHVVAGGVIFQVQSLGAASRSRGYIWVHPRVGNRGLLRGALWARFRGLERRFNDSVLGMRDPLVDRAAAPLSFVAGEFSPCVFAV